MLQGFKFRQQPELAKVLAPLLAMQVIRAYQRLHQPLPQQLVAMPQSKARWLQRGYNQAALLCDQLYELLPLAYQVGLMRRLGKHAEQHKLQAAERWEHAQRTMYCTAPLAGQSIALVDDIVTTGASMTAAAQALKRRGAGVVDGWALAYTLPPALQPQLDESS